MIEYHTLMEIWKKAKWQHINAINMFDYTAIANQLRTVSRSTLSCRTGVVNRFTVVCLAARGVQCRYAYKSPSQCITSWYKSSQTCVYCDSVFYYWYWLIYTEILNFEFCENSYLIKHNCHLQIHCIIHTLVKSTRGWTWGLKSGY